MNNVINQAGRRRVFTAAQQREVRRHIVIFTNKLKQMLALAHRHSNILDANDLRLSTPIPSVLVVTLLLLKLILKTGSEYVILFLILISLL